MNQVRRAKNLAYAGLAGTAGCIAPVTVFAALFCGLWLDARFGYRGLFTTSLLVLSVPISLYIMIRMVLTVVGRIRPQPLVRHENAEQALHLEEDNL